MARRKKEEIITLKVEPALIQALRGIPNRSEFIRNAIQQALESVCPLCGGTGTLTPDQKQHWDTFSQTHIIGECRDCNAMVIVCKSEENNDH